MEKDVAGFGKRGVAGVQILLMIFGLFGFCYFIELVSGDLESSLEITDITNNFGGGGYQPTKLSLSNGYSGTSIPTGETGWFGKVKDFFSGSGGAAAKDQATLAKETGLTSGSGSSAIVSGLQWAAIAYLLGKMIGPMIGLSDENSEALGTSLAAGSFVYEGLATYSEFSGGTGLFATKGSSAVFGATGYGIIIAAIVFAMMYKDVETKEVTFSCLPWQAPNGGDNCEVCNSPDYPCSEYRCKSLGATCEIVNEGTTEEKCVNANPRDVTPPVIRPNVEMLTSGFVYTNVVNSPPSPGFTIQNEGSRDGCLDAFSPLEFGISIEGDLAQCKIDINHTTNFDDMRTYMGGSNLYAYNHSEKFSLPGINALRNGSLILENGQDMTFFIRCKDKNGNTNGAEYAINFCVSDSPDTTAPTIEATSVLNGGCVAEDVSTASVDFYTNEPADCRWSHVDQDYDNMQDQMTCSNKLYQVNAAQLFTCSAELSGIVRDGTEFYIRCKDKAGTSESDRNKMSTSFKFDLRGSTGLVLRNLQPNGSVSGGISPMPVELYAETLFGCDNGKAVCFYSDDGNDWIRFFDSDNTDGIHTQRLDLIKGDYEYFVKCVDAGGNLIENSIDFNLNIDEEAPVIARIYEDSGMLKIVTIKDSECAYSFNNCDFSFSEGTEMPYKNSPVHVADWNSEKTYYIKCRDEFLNEEADCSVVVRPTDDFFIGI